MLEQDLNKEISPDSPKRIIIENQDGTVRYLEEDDVLKWQSTMDTLATVGFVHGGVGQEALNSLEWKEAPSLQHITTDPTETDNA